MQFGKQMRWLLAVILIASVPVMAQERRRRPRPDAGDGAAATQPAALLTPPPASAAKSSDAKPADDKLSVTHHQITLDGKPLAYRATAGMLTMKDDSGKPQANIFFVGYDTESENVGDRPITFLFNGGPGAAAVWLHLGGVGPRVIDLDSAGLPKGPPFRLIDNQATWLGASDLVLVDPVGTGYSRAVPGEDPRNFYGFQNDIHSTAEFIRTYLDKYHRWGSPIYLAGESYGTTRCAALAGYLADRYGIDVNGVTLISTVLDFQQLMANPSSDLSFEVYLPSYTAVAWYHKRLSPDLMADFDKAIERSRKFTTEEYVPALAKGASLSAADREHIISELSALTGLSKDYVDRSNLRIHPGGFEKELLGDGRQIIGRFDGRITGYDPAGTRGGPDFDPSLSYYRSAYSSAFNAYVRDELKYENDAPYEVLSDMVHPWSMTDEGGQPLYVADNLQDALLQHPHLRVQFVSGYYDLATPFFAADTTINRMELDPAARARVNHIYFPSGHMIYHNREASKHLQEAMAKFIQPVPIATTQP